ncbi:MAG: indole-3-glycerol phosphate synthase TrpC [Bacteroidaceae bacterium]|nr:indole-3-glycerol phosphate synthase TrpC [Bacteroidaceae bacterium]MBR6129435.1 indole-3-glycerol phosphate synthase TrpC [Bacteroidaceae bacterium]
MTDILEEIVAHKRIEVAAQKEQTPPRKLYAEVERMMEEGVAKRSLSQALTENDFGIIAEFKRKSPSKGWIKEDGKPEEIPLSYEQNGAAALSILTDEMYFGGSLDFIRKARPLVNLPILRKDFIIDEYQLFQARHVGADAVLLIAADLSKQEVRSLTATAHELALEVLLELHSEHELDYADIDVDALGVNNRNLGTFVTDVQNSFRMAARLPEDKVLVSESGIAGPDTIRLLREAGYRGFLIGETFMKTDNPGLALRQFIIRNS